MSVAQFGVNWREPHKAWKEKKFADDPTYFALERGIRLGLIPVIHLFQERGIGQQREDSALRRVKNVGLSASEGPEILVFRIRRSAPD